MNTQKRLFYYVMLILLWACSGNSQELKVKFEDPPMTYRMNINLHHLPLDESEQDSLISSKILDGYGGFTINSPYNDYLTEIGMAATLQFSEKARAAGMELWLYDERGYPSGNAGDLVIQINPDWEGMGLYKKDTVIVGGEMVLYGLPPGEPEYVAAFPIKDGYVLHEQGQSLLGFIDGSMLKWNAPAGDWKILAVSKYRLYEYFQAAHQGGGKVGANYPSLMIPEVTTAFIDITHEAYARVMGRDLGKYFISTFTDEPSLQAVPFEWHDWAVIPWHGVLSDEMLKRYGYRPEEKIPELFIDAGPAGQKARVQYFHTVGDLITQNFFAPIKEWCERHNIMSGGHLLLEETMMAHVPLYGDIMQCFREMHAPGIDILSCLPENTPVHSAKLASSAAELMGYDRVMAEPCPVADRIQLGGKEPPAWQVRGHLNILIAGGVTDFNNYLKLSNSDRLEKNEINTYVGRVCVMMRGGHSAGNIGLVYPIESLWADFLPEPQKVLFGGWDTLVGGHPDAVRIEQSFRNASRHLFANRWEYHHIDSRAIIDSRVEGGRLVHGNLSWDVLLLPSVTTLPAQAWEQLLLFASQGGRIVALGQKPRNTKELFPDPDLVGRFEDMFHNRENVVFIQDWDPSQLETVLTDWLDRPVRLADENLPLRLAHRKIGAHELLFLINDSEDPVTTDVSFVFGRMGLEEWDPATGQVRSISRNSEVSLLPYHGKIYRARSR